MGTWNGAAAVGTTRGGGSSENRVPLFYVWASTRRTGNADPDGDVRADVPGVVIDGGSAAGTPRGGPSMSEEVDKMSMHNGVSFRLKRDTRSVPARAAAWTRPENMPSTTGQTPKDKRGTVALS